MKILQVCLTYGSHIGGIAEHVRNISERLSKNHEVIVYATDPSGKFPLLETINGVQVKRFKSWAPNDAYYFSRELKTYLKKDSDNYDVVHAHGYHAFPVLYAAQTKGENKLIFTPHYHGTGHTFFNSLLHVPYKFLGKKIFEKADKIVCVSNYERNLVMKHFRVDEEKVVVIPNGINLEEFRGLKKRNKDCRVILYVGRLEKYKGVHYLIKALPKLGNDIVLEIVGKGPYKRTLVKLTRKLSVEERVMFFQDLPRKELLQRYTDADLFVLLSRYEAYSMSVAEALMAKTPCTVANTSALTEWIDNVNCFGIDYPIDLEELAELIKEKIGKYIACVKSDKLQSWNQTVKSLINIYEKV